MPTPDFSFDNATPVLIGTGVGGGTAVAPVAVPGAVADYTPAAPDPHAGDSTRGTPDTPRLLDYVPTIPAPDDTTMQTPVLNFAGQLLLGQLFGIYRAPTAAVIKGIQLVAQVAPVGADVIIDLVDSAGVSLGGTATLPAGETWSEITLLTPIMVVTGAVIRAKVTQIGSAKPGSFLTATLIIQTVTA